MKYVLDDSIAAKWYFHDADFLKAANLRWDFFQRRHELLAPDTFPRDCAEMLVKAERKGIIPSGAIDNHLSDLRAVGVPLHSSFPLLRRAAEIALFTRITVGSSLYIALAEREQCQFLTADLFCARPGMRRFWETRD